MPLEAAQLYKKGGMLNALARHSFGAVLLAVIIEELGLPLPIPTDFMIIFAGTTADRSLPRLGLFYMALTAAFALGASALYAMVRRGGRPLVEHYGRYVHLGPEQLARAEALLSRNGWGGIALGRATPGLRYTTVIACGLLKVSYPRFVTATLAGSSVYIAAFLALGAVFGPAVLDRIHVPAHPEQAHRKVPLAAGIPLLAVWASSRSRQPTDPSRGRVVAAALMGSYSAHRTRSTWPTPSWAGWWVRVQRYTQPLCYCTSPCYYCWQVSAQPTTSLCCPTLRRAASRSSGRSSAWRCSPWACSQSSSPQLRY
jgi:membrane protein DedA with SNARE-associated domain